MMGEAKRRKLANNYPNRGYVEDFRVPDDQLGITIDVEGVDRCTQMGRSAHPTGRKAAERLAVLGHAQTRYASMAAVTYDLDGDVLLIELLAGADGPATEGEEVSPGVMLLYDGDRRVIGIDITAASKTLAPGALDNLPAVM